MVSLENFIDYCRSNHLSSNILGLLSTESQFLIGKSVEEKIAEEYNKRFLHLSIPPEDVVDKLPAVLVNIVFGYISFGMYSTFKHNLLEKYPELYFEDYYEDNKPEEWIRKKIKEFMDNTYVERCSIKLKNPIYCTIGRSAYVGMGVSKRLSIKLVFFYALSTIGIGRNDKMLLYRIV